MKTISQLKLYFLELTAEQQQNHSLSSILTQFWKKYIYYHIKQLWSFLFVESEQFMFSFLIAVLSTSKAGHLFDKWLKEKI